jgi:hypothetical protein
VIHNLESSDGFISERICTPRDVGFIIICRDAFEICLVELDSTELILKVEESQWIKCPNGIHILFFMSYYNRLTACLAIPVELR